MSIIPQPDASKLNPDSYLDTEEQHQTIRNATLAAHPTLVERISQLEADQSVLQLLRNLTGASQSEIAEKMQRTQPEISQLEKRRNYRIETLLRYVEALGYDLDIAITQNGERIPLPMQTLIPAK